MVSGNLPFVATYQDEWNLLADPRRRAIVELLAERPLAVVDLAAGLPISRPAVSQHLKVLKDAGLIAEEPSGTRRVYRLNPVAVEALRDQFDAFWARTLASFGEQAMDEKDSKR